MLILSLTLIDYLLILLLLGMGYHQMIHKLIYYLIQILYFGHSQFGFSNLGRVYLFKELN